VLPWERSKKYAAFLGCARRSFCLPGSTNHKSQITNHKSQASSRESQITNHYSPITNHQSLITHFLIGFAAIRNRYNQMKTKGRLPFKSVTKREFHERISARFVREYPPDRARRRAFRYSFCARQSTRSTMLLWISLWIMKPS
jgi:hypothetical protein